MIVILICLITLLSIMEPKINDPNAGNITIQGNADLTPSSSSTTLTLSGTNIDTNKPIIWGFTAPSITAWQMSSTSGQSITVNIAGNLLANATVMNAIQPRTVTVKCTYNGKDYYKPLTFTP
jgi:hypothetical protein